MKENTKRPVVFLAFVGCCCLAGWLAWAGDGDGNGDVAGVNANRVDGAGQTEAPGELEQAAVRDRVATPAGAEPAKAATVGGLLVRVLWGRDKTPAAGVLVRVLPPDPKTLAAAIAGLFSELSARHGAIVPADPRTAELLVGLCLARSAEGYRWTRKDLLA